MLKYTHIFLRLSLFLILVSIGCKESPTDPGTNITTCTITSYPVGGDVGDTLVIYGVHMSGVLSNTRVAISGTTVPVVSANKDSIVFVVGAGVKTGPITVTVNGHVCTSPQSFFLGYGIAPLIQTLSSTRVVVGDTLHLMGKNLPVDLSTTQVFVDSALAKIVYALPKDICVIVPSVSVGQRALRLVSFGNTLNKSLVIQVLPYIQERIVSATYVGGHQDTGDTVRLDIKSWDTLFTGCHVYIGGTEQPVLAIKYNNQDTVMSVFVRSSRIGTIRISVMRNNAENDVPNPSAVRLQSRIVCADVMYYWKQDSILVYSVDLSQYSTFVNMDQKVYTTQLKIQSYTVPSVVIVYRPQQNCSVIYFTPPSDIPDGKITIVPPKGDTVTAEHFTTFRKSDKDVILYVSSTMHGISVIKNYQSVRTDSLGSTSTNYSDTLQVKSSVPISRWGNHYWNQDTSIFQSSTNTYYYDATTKESSAGSQSISCLIDTIARVITFSIYKASSSDKSQDVKGISSDHSSSSQHIEWSFVRVPYTANGTILSVDLDAAAILSKVKVQLYDQSATEFKSWTTNYTTTTTCTEYFINSIASDARLVLSMKK